MDLYAPIFLASVIGTPILMGFAWWLQLRQQPTNQRWRARALLLGLLAASVNTSMYFIWLVGRVLSRGAPVIWRLKDICGDIGIFLVVAALLGAIAGKGASRIPLALCTLTGFFLWVPVGIL